MQVYFTIYKEIETSTIIIVDRYTSQSTKPHDRQAHGLFSKVIMVLTILISAAMKHIIGIQ